MNKKSAYAWISGITRKSKKHIFCMAALQVMLSLCGIAYAFLFKLLVDAASVKDREALVRTIFLLAGVLLLQITLRFFYGHLEEYVRADLENSCKTRVLSAVTRKDFSTVTAVHSGEWLSRITTDTAILSNGLAQIFPSAAGIFTRILGTAAAIWLLDQKLVFVLFPIAVFVLGLTTFFRTGLKKRHKEVQQANGKLRAFLTERLTNQTLIRAYAMQDQTVRDACERMEQHKSVRMRRRRFSECCNAGINGAFNGAYILCAILCGYGILNGTMTFGNMTAVLQLANQIKNPFSDMTGLLPSYYAMMASAERLMEVEEYPDEKVRYIPEEEMKGFYEKDFRGISLRNITFAYPETDAESDGKAENGAEIFRDYSLKIDKGDYIALTGTSGRGKSTLFKLLLCLYPHSRGDITIHTADGSIPLTSEWRNLFAYVPQSNALFSGTIREILTFGDREKIRDGEKIREALRIACADAFVDELENGVDTVLGENGTGLSEGQLQRLAIARAVFSDRPVLLLDESTSALDEETERKLLDNLRGMTDKTVLIITHRPASLTICNKHIAL